MDTKNPKSNIGELVISMMSSANRPLTKTVKKKPLLRSQTERIHLGSNIRDQPFKGVANNLPVLGKTSTVTEKKEKRKSITRKTRSESLFCELEQAKKELSRAARIRKRTRHYRRNAKSDIFQNLLEVRDQSRVSLDRELGDDDVDQLNQMRRNGASEEKISGWKRLQMARKRHLKQIKARTRFKHAVRMVVIIQRAVSSILESRPMLTGATRNLSIMNEILVLVQVMLLHEDRHKRESREVMSFTEIADVLESDTMIFSGLSFDPRDFKAKKEINISNEVKHILSLPSSARSSEQLQTALYGLQTLRSFAEYPLHMQEKLVKVAWFETIPPKRVIIRQGHYAENFYFVISGAVVVTKMGGNSDQAIDGHAHTAAVLRKGSSFGELALLHHSKRTATVSSQGNVQLLCIGRDDFFDIFMRGQQPGDEPEHIQFLRKLPFMQYWPMEKLIERPEICLFHFYKRGQVIVKDSNHSDWIYVVKSGTCQVLKQLKAVTPQFTSFEVRLPRLNTDKRHTRNKKQKSGRKRMKSTVADYQYLGVPTIHDDTKTTEFERLMSQDDPSLPHSTFMSRRRTMSELAEEKASISESWSLTQPLDMPRTSSESNVMMLPDICPDPRKGATPCTQSYSKSRFREISALNGAPDAHLKQNGGIPDLPHPNDTFLDDTDSNTIQQKDISVFVQIELLQPRDVFGLTNLNMDIGIDCKQSSVSLVSNGAECIMIKKDYFVKYCSDIVRRNIRALTRPYPSPEALQHHLQSHADWSHYKQERVSDILQDIARLKELQF